MGDEGIPTISFPTETGPPTVSLGVSGSVAQVSEAMPSVSLEHLILGDGMKALDEKERLITLQMSVIRSWTAKALHNPPIAEELSALGTSCEGLAQAQLAAMKKVNEAFLASNPFPQSTSPLSLSGTKATTGWFAQENLVTYNKAAHTPEMVTEIIRQTIKAKVYVPLTAFTVKAVHDLLREPPDLIQRRLINGTKVTVADLKKYDADESKMTKEEFQEAYSIFPAVMKEAEPDSSADAMFGAWYNDLKSTTLFTSNFEVVKEFDIDKRKHLFNAPKPFFLRNSDCQSELIELSVAFIARSAAAAPFQGGPDRRVRTSSSMSFPSGSRPLASRGVCLKCGRDC
jgi:hypothetical protein